MIAAFGQSYEVLGPSKCFYHREISKALLNDRWEQTFPITAHIAPTTRCPHRCHFCTYGQATAKSGAVDMPYDLVQKTLDELADVGVKGVIFTGGGEPLLYRQTPEAMRYGKDLGMDVALVTGGDRLSESVSEQIVDSARYARVSLNAGTRELQKLITGLDDFEKVLANIGILARVSCRRESPTDVSVGMVIDEVNVRSIMDLVTRLRQVERSIEQDGFKGALHSIQLRPAVNFEQSKHIDPDRIRSQREYLRQQIDEEAADQFERFMYGQAQSSSRVMDQALETIENEAIPFLRDDGSKIRVLYPRQRFEDLPRQARRSYLRCLALPYRVFIWPNGGVYPCVEWAGQSEFEIGNLRESSLRDILTSPRRAEVFEHINGTVLHTRCAPICAYHELNLLLNPLLSAVEAGRADEVSEFIARCKLQDPSPRHVNFL